MPRYTDPQHSGGSYGPPPGPHAGMYPPPAKSHKTRNIVIAVVAVVAVLCFGGIALTAAGIGGAAKVVEQTETSRSSDVKITSCKRTIIDTVEVGYSITNSSEVEQSYFPEFEVMGTGGAGGKQTRIGTANGFENDVKPGVTVVGVAAGTISGPKGQDFTCRLTGA